MCFHRYLSFGGCDHYLFSFHDYCEKATFVQLKSLQFENRDELEERQLKAGVLDKDSVPIRGVSAVGIDASIASSDQQGRPSHGFRSSAERTGITPEHCETNDENLIYPRDSGQEQHETVRGVSDWSSIPPPLYNDLPSKGCWLGGDSDFESDYFESEGDSMDDQWIALPDMRSGHESSVLVLKGYESLDCLQKGTADSHNNLGGINQSAHFRITEVNKDAFEVVGTGNIDAASVTITASTEDEGESTRNSSAGKLVENAMVVDKTPIKTPCSRCSTAPPLAAVLQTSSLNTNDMKSSKISWADMVEEDEEIEKNIGAQALSSGSSAPNAQSAASPSFEHNANDVQISETKAVDKLVPKQASSSRPSTPSALTSDHQADNTDEQDVARKIWKPKWRDVAPEINRNWRSGSSSHRKLSRYTEAPPIEGEQINDKISFTYRPLVSSRTSSPYVKASPVETGTTSTYGISTYRSPILSRASFFDPLPSVPGSARPPVSLLSKSPVASVPITSMMQLSPFKQDSKELGEKNLVSSSSLKPCGQTIGSHERYSPKIRSSSVHPQLNDDDQNQEGAKRSNEAPDGDLRPAVASTETWTDSLQPHGELRSELSVMNRKSGLEILGIAMESPQDVSHSQTQHGTAHSLEKGDELGLSASGKQKVSRKRSGTGYRRRNTFGLAIDILQTGSKEPVAKAQPAQLDTHSASDFPTLGPRDNQETRPPSPDRTKMEKRRRMSDVILAATRRRTSSQTDPTENEPKGSASEADHPRPAVCSTGSSKKSTGLPSVTALAQSYSGVVKSFIPAHSKVSNSGETKVSVLEDWPEISPEEDWAKQRTKSATDSSEKVASVGATTQSKTSEKQVHSQDLPIKAPTVVEEFNGKSLLCSDTSLDVTNVQSMLQESEKINSLPNTSQTTQIAVDKNQAVEKEVRNVLTSGLSTSTSQSVAKESPSERNKDILSKTAWRTNVEIPGIRKAKVTEKVSGHLIGAKTVKPRKTKRKQKSSGDNNPTKLASLPVKSKQPTQHPKAEPPLHEASILPLLTASGERTWASVLRSRPPVISQSSSRCSSTTAAEYVTPPQTPQPIHICEQSAQGTPSSGSEDYHSTKEDIEDSTDQTGSQASIPTFDQAVDDQVVSTPSLKLVKPTKDTPTPSQVAKPLYSGPFLYDSSDNQSRISTFKRYIPSVARGARVIFLTPFQFQFWETDCTLTAWKVDPVETTSSSPSRLSHTADHQSSYAKVAASATMTRGFSVQEKRVDAISNVNQKPQTGRSLGVAQASALKASDDNGSSLTKKFSSSPASVQPNNSDLNFKVSDTTSEVRSAFVEPASSATNTNVRSEISVPVQQAKVNTQTGVQQPTKIATGTELGSAKHRVSTLGSASQTTDLGKARSGITGGIAGSQSAGAPLWEATGRNGDSLRTNNTHNPAIPGEGIPPSLIQASANYPRNYHTTPPKDWPPTEVGLQWHRHAPAFPQSSEPVNSDSGRSQTRDNFPQGFIPLPAPNNVQYYPAAINPTIGHFGVTATPQLIQVAPHFSHAVMYPAPVYSAYPFSRPIYPIYNVAQAYPQAPYQSVPLQANDQQPWAGYQQAPPLHRYIPVQAPAIGQTMQIHQNYSPTRGRDPRYLQAPAVDHTTEVRQQSRGRQIQCPSKDSGAPNARAQIADQKLEREQRRATLCPDSRFTHDTTKLNEFLLRKEGWWVDLDDNYSSAKPRYPQAQLLNKKWVKYVYTEPYFTEEQKRYLNAKAEEKWRIGSQVRKIQMCNEPILEYVGYIEGAVCPRCAAQKQQQQH